MKLSIKAGSTSVSLYLFILDSTSTTGAGKTGLAYNTASLVAYYVRPLGSATAITLATQTVTGAYSSGGFVEVDATNMPGVYRFDVPDAVIAASKISAVVMLKGATGMAPVVLEMELVAYDPQDSVRLGLTALPNAAAEAAGGLYTRGTGAGQINQDGNGRIDINAVNWKGSTAPAMTGDAFARLGAPAGASVSADVAAVKTDTAAVKLQTDKLAFTVTNQVDANVLDWKSATAPAMTGDAFARLGAPAGASVSADIAGVQADTDNIQTRLPATLVGGRMDSSVGAMAADTLTASALAADAVAEIQSGLSTLDAAAVRTAVGLAGANLDTQLAAIASYIDTEVATLVAGLGALTVSERNSIADAIFARSLGTESYATDGSVPTFAQMMFMFWSAIAQFAISGTTISTKKLNGTTEAMTFTLDSATSPTSRDRAT